MSEYVCHVCGYPNLDEPPWGDDGKTPSFNICPCCGVEFGYEDSTEKAKRNYRKEWLQKGAKWFDDEYKPKNWDLRSQLENIGVIL